MWFLGARHPVLFCDFIEVSSKNIKVMFNLVAFEGEEVYVPVGPRISAHDLSCFIVSEEMISEVKSRFTSFNGFIHIQVNEHPREVSTGVQLPNFHI